MGLTVSAYYAYGLANLMAATQSTQPTSPTDPDLDPSAFRPTGSISNRSFNLTIGCFFGTGN